MSHSGITMICQTCKVEYNLPRTPEIPDHIKRMKCNWCPACEDKANDEYKEWYAREPIKKCDKQLKLL